MSEKKITYCKDLEESRMEYTEYIDNHIKEVWKSYYTAVDAFKDVFPKVYRNKSEYTKLIYNLKNHDASKFEPSEFLYYAARFFPIDGTDHESEKVKNGFKLAWLHHANHNPHHPAYWALADDGKLIIYDIPDIYIIEMLCDWMAMSKYYNSTTLDYWKSESAQKLPMSEYTRSKINEFMEWMLNNNVHTLW